MPMLDIHIPVGSLTEEAEAELLRRLTDLLIRNEGFDPADPVTREVSWAFVHRPAAVYVGGEVAEAPRYKVIPTIPEGQLDRAARDRVVAEVTEAVLDAEAGTWPRDPSRVWVFPTEIPDGYWGGRGRITQLADILERLTDGDPAQATKLAHERIDTSRAERHSHPTPPA